MTNTSPLEMAKAPLSGARRIYIGSIRAAWLPGFFALDRDTIEERHDAFWPE
jgi:hypothetical protein